MMTEMTMMRKTWTGEESLSNHYLGSTMMRLSTQKWSLHFTSLTLSHSQNKNQIETKSLSLKIVASIMFFVLGNWSFECHLLVTAVHGSRGEKKHIHCDKMGPYQLWIGKKPINGLGNGYCNWGKKPYLLGGYNRHLQLVFCPILYPLSSLGPKDWLTLRGRGCQSTEGGPRDGDRLQLSAARGVLCPFAATEGL